MLRQHYSKIIQRLEVKDYNPVGDSAVRSAVSDFCFPLNLVSNNMGLSPCPIKGQPFGYLKQE